MEMKNGKKIQINKWKRSRIFINGYKKYCLLTEPSGLGYSYSTDYEQLGYEFLTNLRKLEQGIISGIANFINYDNFFDFGNFIETSQRLKFVYEIPSKTKILHIIEM